MASMDIFTPDAFSVGQLIGTVDRVPYQPMLLGSMGIFRDVPVRTPFVTLEEKNKTLAIIQTSARGEPLAEGRTFKRKLRRFDTVRIAKGDKIMAEEVAGIRAYGSETELMQVQDLVVEKQTTLRSDVENTMEYHRLGAVMGKVIDADGTVIHDWFAEYGLSAPSDITFLLDTSSTQVEKLIRSQIIRPMQRAAQGVWTPQTYAVALCGDSFYDKLTSHKEVRDSFLNWNAAQNLRRQFGVSDVQQAGSFAGFNYGGVVWLNYRGVDNFDDNATSGLTSLGVHNTKAKFFPVNAPGVFQRALSPGEGFANVNGLGRELYSELELEKRSNPRYADIEVYSYPLHICTRPEMLMSGTENT